MAVTVSAIKNKIAQFARRTGRYAIEKSEFFGLFSDVADKLGEVADYTNQVSKQLIWQNPVANVAALEATYPAPEAGWAAMVEDVGFIYAFNGTNWANTGLKAFPEDVEKVNSIIEDNYPLGKNILDPSKKQVNKMVHPVTGLPFDSQEMYGFFGISVSGGINYSFSHIYGIAWFDNDNNLLLYQTSQSTLKSPQGASYANFDTGNEATEPMVQEGQVYPVVYEPFLGLPGVSVKNLFLKILRLDDSKLLLGNSETKEIIVNGIRQYYQNAEQGVFFGGGAGGENIPNIQANTAWGKEALSSITTGGSNTAFGYRALKSLTTGWDNTAIGSGALEMFEDGIGNQAIGRLALSKLVNGGHNTALTDSALEKLEAGDNNTSVGYGSGVRLINGHRNNLFGVYSAGWYEGANAAVSCNFSDNSVFGAFVLTMNVEGSRNNVFGNNSMQYTVGEDNSVVGYSALSNSENSNRNVVIGNNSGSSIKNANDNVFLGNSSGWSGNQKQNVQGSVVIGANSYCMRDNEVVIGKLSNTHFTINGVEFSTAQLQALKNLV